MKTVVFGKIVEIRHEIDANVKAIKDENGKDVVVYEERPKKKIVETVTGYKEILRYDGEPRYNKGSVLFGSFYYDSFNIGEDEVVNREKEVFRADLNEVHLYVDKVLEVKELYKDEIEEMYNVYIQDFNEQMILSDKCMKSYCDLHKLLYEETDAIELFKLVYPDEEYEIKDGKMTVRKGMLTATPSDIRFLSNYDTIITPCADCAPSICNYIKKSYE